MADVGHAIQAGNRAGQGDRAAAVGAQVGNGSLERVPDAGEIDAEHVLPLLAGELLQGTVAADPGVRNGDIEFAELCDTSFER